MSKGEGKKSFLSGTWRHGAVTRPVRPAGQGCAKPSGKAARARLEAPPSVPAAAEGRAAKDRAGGSQWRGREEEEEGCEGRCGGRGRI